MKEGVGCTGVNQSPDRFTGVDQPTGGFIAVDQPTDGFLGECDIEK